MAENIITKQTIGLRQSQVFSVVDDENTDLNDLSRLAIVARYHENNNIYEELCCLLSLHDSTKAEAIFTAFISYLTKHDVDLNNLSCVTTDADAAMTGKK